MKIQALERRLNDLIGAAKLLPIDNESKKSYNDIAEVFQEVRHFCNMVNVAAESTDGSMSGRADKMREDAALRLLSFLDKYTEV